MLQCSVLIKIIFNHSDQPSRNTIFVINQLYFPYVWISRNSHHFNKSILQPSPGLIETINRNWCSFLGRCAVIEKTAYQRGKDDATLCSTAGDLRSMSFTCSALFKLVNLYLTNAVEIYSFVNTAVFINEQIL